MKRLSLTNKPEPKRKVRFQRHPTSQQCCLPESLLNGSTLIWRCSALTSPSHVQGRDTNIHPYTGVPVLALDVTWMLKALVLPQAFTLKDLYMKYEERPIPSVSSLPISLSPHWPENSIQCFVCPWVSLKHWWSLPWSPPKASQWLPCEPSTVQTLKVALLQAGGGARRSPGVPSNLHFFL